MEEAVVRPEFIDVDVDDDGVGVALKVCCLVFLCSGFHAAAAAVGYVLFLGPRRCVGLQGVS